MKGAERGRKAEGRAAHGEAIGSSKERSYLVFLKIKFPGKDTSLLKLSDWLFRTVSLWRVGMLQIKSQINLGYL